MGEDFAKKGWEFAERQDQHSHSFPSGQTPQRRSYSTLLPSMAPPLIRTRGLANQTAAEEAGSISALMMSDADNFPARLKEVRERLLDFMEREVYPAERKLMDHQMSPDRWTPHPLVEDLKVGEKCI